MLPRQERFLYLAAASLVTLACSVQAKSKDSGQEQKPPSGGGGGVPDLCYTSEYVYPAWFGYRVS